LADIFINADCFPRRN